MASKSNTSKATTATRHEYVLEIKNSRGKVVATKTTMRKSQEDAHRIARGFFAEASTGSTMTISRDGVKVEEFKMLAEGWTFTVLNGSSVRGAERDSHVVPKQTRRHKVA